MSKIVCFFIGHKWGDEDYWGYCQCARCETSDVDATATLSQIIRPVWEVIKNIGALIARRVRRSQPEIPFPPPEHCNCKCTTITNDEDIPF